MVSLALWFLAAFGFTFVVGHSKISLPFREWLVARGVLGAWLCALIECPGCLGVWQGGIAGYVAPMLVTGTGPLLLDLCGAPRPLAVVVLALATSAVNLLLAKKVGMLE